MIRTVCFTIWWKVLTNFKKCVKSISEIKFNHKSMVQIKIRIILVKMWHNPGKWATLCKMLFNNKAFKISAHKTKTFKMTKKFASRKCKKEQKLWCCPRAILLNRNRILKVPKTRHKWAFWIKVPLNKD